MGSRSPQAPLPGHGLRLPRLERRGGGRLDRPGGDRQRARLRTGRLDRPGGVLRLPVDPADDHDVGGGDAAGAAGRSEWRETTRIAGRVPSADRALVLLDGTEPTLRWRTFSEAVATAADALDVELVITLGSLIAEVSHTLPVPITGLASSPELVDELDLERSNYEGPTGIVGVVHDLCRQTGIDSASLWAAVPHYVAAVPNPKAALALLRRLEGMTGIAVEASELEEETTDYEEQIGRAVAANPEIEELVERIEAEQVDMLADEGDELPSADSIAREFQRFLRQRGTGPEPN